jgi:hypothetical protein
VAELGFAQLPIEEYFGGAVPLNDPVANAHLSDRMGGMNP